MIPLSSLASLPNLWEALDGEEIQTREHEWLKQRLGLFTGSEFHRLMSDGRINWKEEFLIQGKRKNYTALIKLDGEIIAESEALTTKAACTDFFQKWKSANAEHRLSVGAESYVMEKAGEILAEIELDGYTSAAMMWGKEHEPEAVQVFADRSGLNPYMTGDSQEFIKSPCCRYGVTPDGLIGDDSGLEIKCPQYATHIRYLLIKGVAGFKETCTDYYWQVQGCMLVTGRKNWHFASYNPTFKDDRHKLKTLVIPRNEHDIKRLEIKLNLAVKMLDSILKELGK